jgi:hypothetical protein
MNFKISSLKKNMKYYTYLDQIFSPLLLVTHAYILSKMKQNWKVITKREHDLI